jgi:hypothetical protein|tara:strand:- start:358 stop:1152 length:795 start_codon:yes stop_codon:yes gene_type:complete
MKKIKIYCVTNKKIDFINNKSINFAWVGKNETPDSYLGCNTKENIFHKEKYYSELTFHYWFWKNLLSKENDDAWIGFCQKRRYWIQETDEKKIDKSNINQYLLSEIDETQNIEALICKPININGVKKIKLLKRGWRNLIKNPLIFMNEKYQNIELQFDMHHGYGNLYAAIQLLNNNDRNDFLNFVRNNTKFNPHIMFVSKKKIIQDWFFTLFEWLEKCEKEFGFENLKGYDKTRIYAYLAERFLSFWFRKYTKYKEQPWSFIDV